MKATVNKSLFLSRALPMDFDRISISAYNGILSVASFANAGHFRIPAYIVFPGQAYLTSAEWRELVQKAQDTEASMIDIEL